MTPEVQKVFNNEFLESCGLDEYVVYDKVHDGIFV